MFFPIYGFLHNAKIAAGASPSMYVGKIGGGSPPSAGGGNPNRPRRVLCRRFPPVIKRAATLFGCLKSV
jgi:hypothetical protein